MRPPSLLAALILTIIAPSLAASPDPTTPPVEAPALSSTAPVATILCYHQVDPDEEGEQHATIPRRNATGNTAVEQRRYTATPASFVAQLDYLQSNGYTVVPLAHLVEHLRGERESLPPRPVVITVDDGWACAYTDMFPELSRRELPWTLFVYPKIVGRGSHAVTWKQLEELAAAGVDIQSHSFTHPFLTAKNNPQAAEGYEEFLRRELLDSRLKLEQATGKPVQFLCYPFGDYDASVATAAAAHGYAAAVTTVRGPITRSTPLMELKRYLIHNDTTLEQFKSFLLP